jgi:hypothetical protein
VRDRKPQSSHLFEEGRQSSQRACIARGPGWRLWAMARGSWLAFSPLRSGGARAMYTAH